MSETTSLSRRDFMRNTTLLGGSLLLSFYLPAQAKGIKGVKSAGNAAFTPNAFLSIEADGTVKITTGYAELGQGIYTAIAQLIGEELEMDWSKIKIEAAPMNEAYNHLVYHCQMTGGSSSISSDYDRMRQVGATAKYMLVAAAAKDWGVDMTTCSTANGIITNKATGAKVAYEALVDKAALIVPPKEIPLKTEKQQTLIGKGVKRLDTSSKTNGSAIYGIDVNLPGMLISVISRCPAGLGKVKSLDDTKAKASPGVVAVINLGKMVAVVATGYWAAEKGRELLDITWDRGEYEGFSTKAEMAQYKKDVQKPGLLAMKKGDISKKTEGGKTFLKEFEFPYLTAAVMEPLNCVADVKADSADIYVGTQGQTFDFYGCVGALKMKPEQVKIHTQ